MDFVQPCRHTTSEAFQAKGYAYIYDIKLEMLLVRENEISLCK